MTRRLWLVLALLLAGCGGGGGSTSTSSSTTETTDNTVALTVDAGPAGLDSGANGYVNFNTAYITITLCAPAARPIARPSTTWRSTPGRWA